MQSSDPTTANQVDGFRESSSDPIGPLDADYRVLLELAGVGVVSADPSTGHFIRFNERFCEITGRTAEQLRSLTIADITHPEDWAESHAHLAALLQGETETFVAEKRFVRPSGSIAWVCVHASVQRDAQGRAMYTLASVQDISWRRQNEEALVASEGRYRLAIEATELGTWDWDPVRQELVVSEQCKRIFGLLPRDRVTHETLRARIHPDDQRTSAVLVDKAMRERGVYQFEFRCIWPDGSVHWVASKGRVLSDANNEPVRFIGTMVDITERKRADEALRESQAQLAEAQTIAKLGSWQWSMTSQRICWSEQACKMAGLDPSYQPTLDELRALIPQPEYEQLRQAILDCASTGKPFVLRHRVQCPSGQTIVVLRRGHRVSDMSGKPLRVVGTIQDITEQVQAEEQRLALEARVQEAHKVESLAVLAGGVAHDFNNILVSVIGYADLALMSLEPDSPVREMLEQVRQAGVRASELSKQMLAFSGRGRFVVAPVQLNQLVLQAEPFLRASISRLHELRFELGENSSVIKADAGQIRQALLNLVINACEAIGDQAGTIVVRTRYLPVLPASTAEHQPASALAVLEVEDDGRGMDASTKARIFDPFFTTKFTGRGLGLAAVSGIVRGHGGTIHVHSEPGKGTRFQILFPASELPATDPVLSVRPSAKAARSRSGLILVVDDEPSVRDVARIILERAGYEVLLAPNGQAGVQLFEKHKDKVLAVVLDLTMPVMGGEQAFVEMRQIRADLPVLLASGYGETDATAPLVGLGLAGFLSKPFRAEELLHKLSGVLESPGRAEPS